jgi:hypothetical protein
MRPAVRPRPVARYEPSSSHARKPPAQRPGTSMRPTSTSSRPTRRKRLTDPSTNTHQKSAGAPSANNSISGSIDISVPAAMSSSS